MNVRKFGDTQILTSRIGLGCSRIASLSTPVSPSKMVALMEEAVEQGVSFFDTADVYGQGDSERLIAELEARIGKRITVATKAGLQIRAATGVIRRFKPFLRPLAALSKHGRSSIEKSRQAAEKTCFEPSHIRKQLCGSLRRLRRDQIDLFLLHSPPRELLEKPDLFDLLKDIRNRGYARHVGVSCRAVADAELCLRHPTVEALQLPLNQHSMKSAVPVLDLAREKGVGVIAREVLSGADLAGEGAAKAALESVLANRNIDVVLVGTTSRPHLMQNIDIARRMDLH